MPSGQPRLPVDNTDYRTVTDSAPERIPRDAYMINMGQTIWPLLPSSR